MPRGGYRPGAGRPKGASKATKKVVKKAAAKEGKTPLDYMLDVMNDPAADDARRDRMAIAAAPFVHKRAADVAPGKKEAAKKAAKTAGAGSDWGDDLQAPTSSSLN